MLTRNNLAARDISRAPADLSRFGFRSDHKILLSGAIEGPILEKYARGWGGITTSDSPRFRAFFWEVTWPSQVWAFQQGTVQETSLFGGREHLLRWERCDGGLAQLANGGGATIAGRDCWGKGGVAVKYTGSLRATLYGGEVFENTIGVLLPPNPDHLPAIWVFCSSPDFELAVRSIDKKLGVTCNTLAKVPFDSSAGSASRPRSTRMACPSPRPTTPPSGSFTATRQG